MNKMLGLSAAAATVTIAPASKPARIFRFACSFIFDCPFEVDGPPLARQG
jgi:hypothetical protein